MKQHGFINSHDANLAQICRVKLTSEGHPTEKKMFLGQVQQQINMSRLAFIASGVWFQSEMESHILQVSTGHMSYLDLFSGDHL